MNFKEKKYKCNKCGGIGKIPCGHTKEEHYSNSSTVSNCSEWNTCTKCWGQGDLDWIENIKGREYNPHDSLTASLVKTIYPKLIAKDLVSVQPMSMPICNPYFIRVNEDEEI